MNPSDNLYDELKDAPLLHSLSNESPFNVPDGYFESLPTLIETRIAEEKKGKIVSIFRLVLQPKYAVAACLVTFALVTAVLYNRTHETPPVEILLSYDELSASVYFNDINEELLVEELSSLGISSDNSSLELENYLLENTNDLSTLENEL